MSGVFRNIDPPLWCGGRTHSLGGEGVWVNSSEDARHCSVLYMVKTEEVPRQEKQENSTMVESHLSFSLEAGASVCLLSTTTGGAPPYLRQHHVTLTAFSQFIY
jgi:hypothetical protein